MKIVKPTDLGLLPRPFTFNGTSVLCVSAYAFFSFNHERRLLEESAMWDTLGNTLLENEIFDTGEPKPQAEYLVYGRCHPQKSARAARVRVRVGKEQQKALEIYGDRQWFMDFPGDPAILDPLRICWRYAYGGPGHPYNPQGTGFVPDADGRIALPNILSPDKSADPDDANQLPAGLTAYPLDSPLRTQYYGTFDKDWLQDCWPGLPRDTNPNFFMTAPKDQWLPAFFQGDEPFFIEGMHPQHHFQEATLPGMRARIFAQKKGEPPEPFVEGETRADTLWLLPEEELAILCYRTQIPTCDDEASDITHLLAVWEHQDEAPRDSAYYRALLTEQLAPVEVQAAETEPEEKPGPKTAPKDTKPEAPKIAAEDPELAALKEETAKIEAETRALQKKHGISDAELEKHLPRKQPADVKELTEADLQKATAEIETQTKQLLQEKGMTMRDMERMLQERTAMDRMPDLKTLLKQTLESGKLSAEDKGKLSAALAEFMEAEKALSAAEAGMPAAAAATAATPPPAPTEQDPEPQAFAGRDLSGRDFSGKDLRDTDFSNAVLSGCNFKNSNCARANFSNALLDKADFSEAWCENTIFKQVIAPEACFLTANLRQAVLTESDFTKSDFSNARMTEADLSESLYENARMLGVLAPKTASGKADFTGADLTGADFTDAELNDADFTEAKIGSALFTRAQARGARFFGATGDLTRFENADLSHSRADAATELSEAGFSYARLRDAKWAGARLNRAKCIDVDMDRADFSESDFSGSTFNGISARHADFSKAIFGGVHLQHSNLFYASFRKANLIDVKIRQCNLFGADLYKIRLSKGEADAVILAGLNLKRTLLDPALFSDYPL